MALFAPDPPPSPPPPALQPVAAHGASHGKRRWYFSTDFFQAVAAVALAAIWIWLNHQRFVDVEPWSELVANGLVAALAVLAASIFLGRRLRREQQEQLAEALVQIDVARKDFFAKLPDEQQREVVREFFQQICPGTTAAQVDQHIRYLMRPRARRREFEYDATLAPLARATKPLAWGAASQPGPAVVFDPGEYFILTTRLTYRIQLIDEWRNVPRVYAAICLDDKQLNAAFDDQYCVYREQLLLNRNERQTFPHAVRHLAAIKATGGPLDSITGIAQETQLFRVEVDVNNRSRQVQLTYDERLGLKFAFSLLPDEQAADELKFELKLSLPFGRTLNFFPVMFGNPTHIRSMRFDASAATDDLQAYDALTVMDEKLVHIERRRGVCAVRVGDQWVMATSGVFFWWPTS